MFFFFHLLAHIGDEQMFLKSFIHFVINKDLKNYGERLDHEKLQFSLKNGEGRVFCRSSSIDFLSRTCPLGDSLNQTPIHWFVEADNYLSSLVFRIEKLQVTIPWKNLLGKPMEIDIEGVSLLILPKKGLSSVSNIVSC